MDKLSNLIATQFKGAKIVHINSTKEGGGVAEILRKMVPMMNDIGFDTHWEVLEGNQDFYICTNLP
jgi:trehalose synthase